MKKRFFDLRTKIPALLLACAALTAPLQANATSSFELFGEEVVLSARQHLGLPYVWGGEDPRKGFDCSGLIKYTFQEFNVQMPHRADLQYQYGEPVPRTQLEPGDLVFFSTGGYPIGHVGLYAGKGEFIHAPRRGRPVTVDSMNSGYYSQRFVGARRIRPEFF